MDDRLISSSKEHFRELDGLRGVAAFLVVAYHTSQAAGVYWPHALALHHAYLAVDFFFVLSGFVIAHAYGAKVGQMGVREFLIRRIVRLHPLALLGLGLGLLAFLFDPFAPLAQLEVSPLRLLAAMACNIFMLPGPALAGREIILYPLNGPIWSLAQEYLASLAFAATLYRLPARALAMVAGLAALGLAISALVLGSLEVGGIWEFFAGGPLRMTFSFVAGLLLYRLRGALPVWKMGFAPLSLLLLLIAMAPEWPSFLGLKLNGIYDLVVVVAVLPAIVLAGANAAQAGSGSSLCRLSGRLSYALYIIHMPFTIVWGGWVNQAAPGSGMVMASAAALAILILVAAHLAEKHWDRPIRAVLGEWLASRNRALQSSAA